MLVALFDADAFSMKPIIASSIAANHESARVGSLAETVEIIAYWCTFLFLLLFLLWVHGPGTI